ncbi:MAG: RagB/SusD family nutrient uptake outer membrane protein [Prevotella sp.]|nr:RagB/SusD family nutrient uptake outer membrane protein [Prevotella sp.]
MKNSSIIKKLISKITVIGYCLLVLGFVSCDDMFNPAEENKRQLEDLTKESTYAHGLLIYAYERLPYATTTQTDVATDDAVTNVTNNTYLTMATGSWASDNNPMSQWDNCKHGIQYANLFLSIVDKVSWAPSAASKQQMFIDRMKGEAFGIRAVFYYYLLQAHGGYADDGILYGVPLITVAEDGSSDFNQPRATFADCVKQCFADCDSAIALLPDHYEDIKSEEEIPAKYLALGANVSGYNLVFGQKAKNLLSGKAAQAVKAQVALLAASPAFRDQSGVTSAEAATFCANVLKGIGGVSGLDDSGNTWYKNKSKIDNSTTTEIPEIIWREDRRQDNDQEKENFPPTLYGRGSVNPSQNLVDAFPMASGRPITDPQSGYDSQNPYFNRDPRLAEYIICHGSTFKKNVISTGVDMPNEDGETNDNLNSIETSTRTGYYLKKLLREEVSVSPTSSSSQYHIYPRIRYTEIFLAYAEAANDAWGPQGDPTGVGFTAYDVIKAIRGRASLGRDEYGFPLPGGDEYLEEIKSDKAKMTELIRNERRIELCFENKRFWDLRRWQMPLNESVKGMKIEKVDPEKEDSPLKYTTIEVEDRKYDSTYQWYGPIPKGEVLKWSNLSQNKGW